MKAALTALALALSATVAMDQDSRTPEEQKKAREDFINQVEKSNAGIRQRLHDAEINRRAKEEMRRLRANDLQTREGRCPPSHPDYPDC